MEFASCAGDFGSVRNLLPGAIGLAAVIKAVNRFAVMTGGQLSTPLPARPAKGFYGCVFPGAVV